MNRVFVTQQPKPNSNGWTPNLQPATQFGAIHYVFNGSDRPYCDPDHALEVAAEVLRDFNPDKDYVLWPNTGDPAAVWAVLLALARMPINKIKFLYWERKLVDGVRTKSDGFYTPVTFNLCF